MKREISLSNTTSHTIIVKKITNVLGQITGLIGKKKPNAIFFSTRFGIHTFGLKFPIDVLILNTDFNVVVLKENLLPNNFFFWNPSFTNVIELPSTIIKQKNIKISDRICLLYL